MTDGRARQLCLAHAFWLYMKSYTRSQLASLVAALREGSCLPRTLVAGVGCFFSCTLHTHTHTYSQAQLPDSSGHRTVGEGPLRALVRKRILHMPSPLQPTLPLPQSCTLRVIDCLAGQFPSSCRLEVSEGRHRGPEMRASPSAHGRPRPPFFHFPAWLGYLAAG